VVLDHALTGLSRDGLGRAWARLASSSTEVALWAGQGYHWLQVFTGDTLDASRRRRAVAVEPMTCPPNAFATGTDLISLDPGDSVTHVWGIEVTRR
jgi:aldose 1-epimerase